MQKLLDTLNSSSDSSTLSVFVKNRIPTSREKVCHQCSEARKNLRKSHETIPSPMKQIFPSPRVSKRKNNNEEEIKIEHFPPIPVPSKLAYRKIIHSEPLGSTRTRRLWTPEEEAKLIKGVNTYGKGNWALIRRKMHLTERTNVELKDKWRNICKKLVYWNCLFSVCVEMEIDCYRVK